MRRLETARLYYGWIVVAVTLVALLMTAGARSMVTVLIRPLEDEFGWSRGTISAAVVVNLLLTWVATIVQRRLVGEKSPLELSRVGNLDGGRNA